MSRPAATPPFVALTVGAGGFFLLSATRNLTTAHRPPTTTTMPPPIHPSTARLLASCKNNQMNAQMLASMISSHQRLIVFHLGAQRESGRRAGAATCAPARLSWSPAGARQSPSGLLLISDVAVIQVRETSGF